MQENLKSQYQDTSIAKNFIKKYRTNTLIFSLGLAIMVISLIPWILIISDDISKRLIPTAITAFIGLAMVFYGKYRLNSLKESSRYKYTVAAYDYIDKKGKSVGRIFARDLVIGILLIILSLALYFLMQNPNSPINEELAKYITCFLILILAIALFMISNSKGRRDGYKFIKENI